MTKQQFHEEELNILRKESKTRSSMILKIGGTIILLLLGSVSGGVYMFVDHEQRISRTETVQQTYLDNSGVEFTARSVGKEVEDRLSARIDEKADKDIVIMQFNHISTQLNEVVTQLKELKDSN